LFAAPNVYATSESLPLQRHSSQYAFKRGSVVPLPQGSILPAGYIEFMKRASFQARNTYIGAFPGECDRNSAPDATIGSP
jgi:hypothetical protein